MKGLPQISLSQKVLVLVTLPLLVQFFLMVGLAKVQDDAEKQLAEANVSRFIADAINHLSNDVYAFVAYYGNEKSIESFSTSDEAYIEFRKKIDKDFEDIKTLAVSKPNIQASVDKALKAVDLAIADIIPLQNSINQYGGHFRADRGPLWKKLREDALQAVTSDLFAEGKKERKRANRTAAIRAAMRQRQQRVMITGAVGGILLTIAIATILTRGITNRLAKMTENTYRLSRGEPLHPVQGGSDDISKLDQSFHSMSRALEASARKESAFIDSANDVLCMIAPGGSITSINPACEKRLGFPKSDLIGSPIIELVVADDQARASSYLAGLREGSAESPVDLKLKRLDGSVADTLWSAQWSKEEDSFFCIIHDITQIREAERTKREVLSMVTHDLKTPLTTLQLLLNQLPGAPAEKGVGYITMASRNVDHMAKLVADLLDLEKSRSGKMKLNKEKIELSECFESMLQTTSGLSEANHVKVICQESELMVEADADALTRVIINLVSNAIKFSPEGSEVIVGADRSPGVIHVWVQDRGPGIPAAELDRVFERFQQVEGSSKRAGGTGLGLAICKEFVRLHGGKIWVESEPGQGSKFIFTLPS